MPVPALQTRTAGLLLAAGVAVLGAGPAFAADAEHKAGMPQFDVSRFPSQIFWLVVCFAILYFLMANLVLPRIGRTIEDRERKIQSDLAEAQRANDLARDAGAEQEKALSAARHEASQVLRTASEAAAAKTTTKLHEIGDRLATEIAAAERRINEQRGQAIASLTGMSTEIAQAVLGKLAGPVDAGQVAQAVETAAKAGHQ